MKRILTIVQDRTKEKLLSTEFITFSSGSDRDLLCICAWCNRIRDENGQWIANEGTAAARSYVDLTHGICPRCSKELHSEFIHTESRRGQSESGF